jgi:hypothetical protein
MPSLFEQLAKNVLALLAACIILGGVYNLGVVTNISQPDYFYLLTYLDHINSAVIAGGIFFFVLFAIYGLWLIVGPFGARLAALLRLDRLNIAVSARLIAAVTLAFLAARFLLRWGGFINGEFNVTVTAIVVFVAAGLLILKFVTTPEPESAVFAVLFAAVAAFVLGGTWVEAARANKGPYPVIEADRTISAKGFKTFSEFTLAIDRDGAVVVLRSRDIKKITVAPAPAEPAAPPRPPAGGQRK